MQHENAESSLVSSYYMYHEYYISSALTGNDGT
jgi:hypothetical protein